MCDVIKVNLTVFSATDPEFSLESISNLENAPLYTTIPALKKEKFNLSDTVWQHTYLIYSLLYKAHKQAMLLVKRLDVINYYKRGSCFTIAGF